MDADSLSLFAAPTRAWFQNTFATATAAQKHAWRVIANGGNALVVAPTGSGKTLSAFLWALDALLFHRRKFPDSVSSARCEVLYVSPLKALAYDIDRNLRQPLLGISNYAKQLGVEANDVSVAMRTGDTSPSERRRFSRHGSDILITTPESLFLLLTSRAREALSGIKTVIVDEVHSVCGTKRGAHLALSLERLDALLTRPAQRIGLSATVNPTAEAATFIGGKHPVAVVDPPAAKTIDVRLEVTVPDLAHLTEVDDHGQPSVWPSIVARLYDLVTAHSSTIIFANSRLLTEQLCARLNEYATGHGVPPRFAPASMMAQSQAAAGSPSVLARAHHGSMSRIERLEVEEALKAGKLAAVVATSSLELGIDMGSVDQVVHIGAPFSVASGIQRAGRAGHQVGAISSGTMFATHRADLLAGAVTVERMMKGQLEPLRPPSNPLDVLAQQIVAMVAMDEWQVDHLYQVVRSAAPFRELTTLLFHNVLDMLSGKYPSTAFAGLKPKLVWDRERNILRARKGAQRLAVQNGGTIPDRGLYNVVLSDGGTGSHVGELDEEMVYESRIGDVFMLGSTSWRIDAITPDRVLVSPAPGEPARLPFWKGEDPGRPVELGQEIASRIGSLDNTWLSKSTLSEYAVRNLREYVTSQREQTGVLPDNDTIVMERFRDELGDWRVAIHCLLGSRINRAWALAISARLQDRYGINGHVMGTDDGIVIRLPDMEHPPGPELVQFDEQNINQLIASELSSSALFSARFRECAARALLLPRRQVGKRQPLWQQRQRANQLFAVAVEFDDFPITIEAARECVEDYFDLPALAELMSRINQEDVTVQLVVTRQASPFAVSLLTAYTAGNLYGEDEPLAERRAQAIHSGALSSLLGDSQVVINAEVLDEVARFLSWRDGRPLRDADDTAELLRVVGDQNATELADRAVSSSAVDTLIAEGRCVWVQLADEDRLIAIEDAARYRDGLGIVLPEGIPEALLEPVSCALGDLVARYARTHPPFNVAECAQRFGANPLAIESTLRQLATDGVTDQGMIGGDEPRWYSIDVLRLLRRKTLASLRAEISPVPTSSYTSFLSRWHQVGQLTSGIDAVADVIDQLQATPIPFSALESLVLPARIHDYEPSQLDELTATGELLWTGTRPIADNDGWVCLAYSDNAATLFPPPNEDVISSDLHSLLLDRLSGPSFFRELLTDVDSDDSTIEQALWDLVWGGWVSNDSLVPLRALIRGDRRSRPQRQSNRASRFSFSRERAAPLRTTPLTAGRWFKLADRDTDPTSRAYAAVASQLDRDGVVVRGSIGGTSRGFAGLYPVFAKMEEKGLTRRGYFVEGLGAAQFADPAAVDLLRSSDKDDLTVALSACDPANPYGWGLPWPRRNDDGPRHRAGRKPGALVVLSRGELVWFVERGNKTILTFRDEPLTEAASALAKVAERGVLSTNPISIVNDEPIGTTAVGKALITAGFRVTPQGLRYHLRRAVNLKVRRRDTTYGTLKRCGSNSCVAISLDKK